MKPSNFSRTLLIFPFAGACLSFQSAIAEEWYIDSRIGLVNTFIYDDEINDRLRDQNLPGYVTSKDTLRLGGRIDLGWQWHRNWSVEAGYVWMGDADFETKGTGPIDKTDADAIEIDSGSGPELGIKGQYALIDQWSAYGRGGLWMWDPDFSTRSSLNTKLEGVDLFVGLGVQWQFQSKWTASLGWDGYKADQDMNHFFSVGAQYHFGGKSKASKRTSEPSEEKITNIDASELNTIPEELKTSAPNEVASSPKAAAESPATVTTANTTTTSTEAATGAAATTSNAADTNAAAPAAATSATAAATSATANMTSKIKTDIYIQRELQDLKMLLAFNSGDTKLKIGDEKFNRLAEWLKTHPEAKLRISGHTDNQEAVSKNETLSYERAATVARILISKGVPSDQLRLEGLGASKPLFDNGTEVGRRINRRAELTLE